ncbi:MAG: hypothetical protein RR280_05305 [Bacteroidaceae bacterium]
MKKLLFFMCFASFLFVSCGDDEDNSGPSFTKENAKAKLEQIGIDLSNQIDIDTQKPVLDFVGYFTTAYSGYEFSGNNEDFSAKLGKLTKTIHKVVRGDQNSFAQVSKEVIDIYGLTKEYWGDYTPDEKTKRWIKSKASDISKVVLKYNDQDKNPCSISLTASPTFSNVTTTIEGETQVVKVPNEFVLKLTQGKIDLATLKITSSIDQKNKKAKVHVLLASGGYTWDEDLTVNNTNAINSFEMKNNSTSLIKATSRISGTNLADIASYYPEQNVTITALSTDVVVLGEMTVKVELTDVKKFHQIEKEWENSTGSEADDYKYTAEINKCIDAGIYMNSSKLCSIIMHNYKSYEDDGDGNKTEIWNIASPLMEFEDGTTYAFEEYFNETDFQDLIVTMDDFLKKIENLYRLK